MWKWDLIFLIAFLLMAEMRYVNPSIAYAEKFMDQAFLASLMRTPVVPPPDPWYAGGSLNIYYYLGYWMAGALGLTTAVPSSVVFNLAIPTVVGLAAVNLWMVGDLLLPRLSWLPVLVLLLVNPSFVVHTGIQVGVDIRFEALRNRHKAIYIATGTH